MSNNMEFICADCDKNIDRCICNRILYSNMTGAALSKILEIINLSYVQGVYIVYFLKEPTECIKQTYPTSSRFVSLNNKTELELFQYKSFYHFKLFNNLLKCYDCNDNKKNVYQILLTDDELTKIQKILPRYHTMIHYVDASF